MMGLLRTGVLMTLGLSWKAKAIVEDLVKKGEENPSEIAKRLRELTDSADRGSKEVQEKLRRLCEEVRKRIKLPTKEDIERLDKEIADLAARINPKR